MKNNLKKNNQFGFSLIEMLIVMVVTSMVMIAAFSLMKGAIITATANYQLTDANQNLRNGQEYIIRDLLVTGSGVKGTANIWLPTSFVTKYLTVRSASDIDSGNTGYVNLGAVLSDDNIPANTQVADAATTTSIKPRTDRITVLAVDKSFTPISLPSWWTDYTTGRIWIPGDIDQFSVGEIYYLSDGGSGTFGTVTGIDKSDWCIKWEDGDVYNLNRIGWTGNIASATGYSDNASTLMRVQIIQYFVDQDGKLIRRVFGVKG